MSLQGGTAPHSTWGQWFSVLAACGSSAKSPCPLPPRPVKLECQMLGPRHRNLKKLRRWLQNAAKLEDLYSGVYMTLSPK